MDQEGKVRVGEGKVTGNGREGKVVKDGREGKVKVGVGEKGS